MKPWEETHVRIFFSAENVASTNKVISLYFFAAFARCSITNAASSPPPPLSSPFLPSLLSSDLPRQQVPLVPSVTEQPRNLDDHQPFPLRRVRHFSEQLRGGPGVG